MSDDGNYLYRVMRGLADPTWLSGDDVELGVILDLGHDVRVMFMVAESGGARIGLRYSHRMPDGPECAGSVLFEVPEAEGLPGPRWDLVSMDPLHIEPSLLCRRCDHHGFIRDGRWEGTG